jgi:hypothetical protein
MRELACCGVLWSGMGGKARAVGKYDEHDSRTAR